jgi:isocitrate dehydrogenase (NAD+)
MKTLRIAVTPGDGIAYECMDSVMAVLENAEKYFKDEMKLEYVYENIGHDVWKETGACVELDGVTYGGISEKALEVFDTTDAMIYIATSGGDFPRGIYTPFPVIRKRYGIFANVRPSKTLPNVFSLKPDIDLVLVREQTEGLWMGREADLGNGVVTAEVRISRAASEKIARFAFELARERDQKKHVVVAHKDNVLNKAFGMFVDSFRRVAKEYPDCTLEDMHTDVLPYQLMKQPERFDVIATTNMYGDAISGQTTGICGGLGVGPSGEYGDNWAVFRPVHGSAPKWKGKDRVNPTAGILSGVMMLEYLGNKNGLPKAKVAANHIRKAINKVLVEKKHLTQDLGGTAGTKEMTSAIIEAME